MVNLVILTCILTTLAVLSGVAAQSAPSQPPLGFSGPAPAAAVDCLSLIYDMMDCMEFLIVGGSETTPEQSCCSGFKTVLKADADCICYALSNSGSLGLEINMTRAQALSSQCGLSTSPISNCHVLPSPIGSPANPPTVSAPPSNYPTLPPPAVTPSGIAAAAPSPRISSIAGAPESQAPAPSPAGSAACAISATLLILPISFLLFIIA